MGMAAPARRQIQGADRPGTLAERRRSSAAGARARSEPDQPRATSAFSCGATSRAESSITSIGVFNGAPETNSVDNADINHAKHLMGGCSSSRSRRSRCAGSAISASGSRWAPAIARGGCPPRPRAGCRPGLSPYRTAGQNTFFQYLAPATDTTGALTTFAHERSTTHQPSALLLLRLVRAAGGVPVAQAGRAEGEQTPRS